MEKRLIQRLRAACAKIKLEKIFERKGRKKKVAKSQRRMNKEEFKRETGEMSGKFRLAILLRKTLRESVDSFTVCWLACLPPVLYLI